MDPMTMLAIASAGGGLIQSLTRDRKTGKNIDALIAQLMQQSQTGLPDEIRANLLNTGNQNIDKTLSAERNATMRNLARQGFGNSTVMNDFSKDITRRGVNAKNGLNSQISLMDFNARNSALQGALSALFNKDSINRSNEADFGTPLGLALSGILNKPQG